MLGCKLILSGSEWLPNFLTVVVLWRLADLMEEHQEELATIESLDSGAVYTLALKTHIGMSIATLRYFAGWADKIQVSTLLTFWLICLCKVDMPKQKKLGVEIALILTGDNRYALHQGLVLSIDISRRSCFCWCVMTYLMILISI